MTCTCCQCGTSDDDKGPHGSPKQPPVCPIPSPYQPRLVCSRGSAAPGAKKCCQWCCENCAAKNRTFKKAAKPKQEASGSSPKEPCSPSCNPVEQNLPDESKNATAEKADAEKATAEKAAAEKAAAEKAAAEREVAEKEAAEKEAEKAACLLYTSPSPRDATLSRMPSSA